MRRRRRRGRNEKEKEKEKEKEPCAPNVARTRPRPRPRVVCPIRGTSPAAPRGTCSRAVTGGSRSPSPTASGPRSWASTSRTAASTSISASSLAGSQCKYAEAENKAPSAARSLREPHHLADSVEHLARAVAWRRSRRACRASPVTERPVWTLEAVLPPVPASASIHHAPTHSVATDTSAIHKGSVPGVSRRRSTAVRPARDRQPLRRRAASRTSSTPRFPPHGGGPRRRAPSVGWRAPEHHQGGPGHVAGNSHPPAVRP